MSLATASLYWVIVAIWLAVLGAVVVFYLRDPHGFGATRLLLAVVALDTLRNIIENTYFGVYFGGQYGLFPPSVVGLLGQPLLLILPKLFDAVAGCLVLFILLLHWLPAVVRERETVEREAEVFREQATHDELTGLFNRRHFLALAEQEWQRAQRYKRPLSLLMLDIDLFKSINDRHGHDTGDRVLATVAQFCQESTRPADIVARLGGEEFAVLLPETRQQDGSALAERLRQRIAALRIPAGAAEIATSVSIGVSEAALAMDVPELIKQADIALYTAKQSGRNRVCLFGPASAVPRQPAA